MTDLCRIVALVKRICERHLPHVACGPGRPLAHSSTLILQLVVLQYLHGFTSEAAYFRWLARQSDLPFPSLPSRSQYNRRVRQLSAVVPQLLTALAQELGLDRERVRIIDSAPVPAVSHGLSDKSKRFPRGEHTNYGYCPTQRLRYYGCKLHLVTSKTGIPVHYQLGPANRHDVRYLVALGERCRLGSWLLGDKGYFSHARRDRLKYACGVHVLIPQRKRYMAPNPDWVKRLLRKRRGNIETTFSQLKDQMGLGRLGAKSYQGLEARVAGCLLAYVVGVRFNANYHRPYRELKSIFL